MEEHGSMKQDTIFEKLQVGQCSRDKGIKQDVDDGTALRERYWPDYEGF